MNSLDEILVKNFATKPDGGAWCTVHLHKLDLGICLSCEAKAQIEQYIEDKVLEARIEELETLNEEETKESLNFQLLNRLMELKALNKEGEKL
jgi:hypothetical protein